MRYLFRKPHQLLAICSILLLMNVAGYAQEKIDFSYQDKVAVLGPHPMPPIAMTSVPAGEKVVLSALKPSDLKYPGQPSLVIFYEVGCGVCLQTLEKAIKDGAAKKFNIITVDIDDAGPNHRATAKTEDIVKLLTSYNLNSLINYRISLADYQKYVNPAGSTASWMLINGDLKVEDFFVSSRMPSEWVSEALEAIASGKYKGRFAGGMQYTQAFFKWSPSDAYIKVEKIGSRTRVSHYMKTNGKDEKTKFKDYKVTNQELIADGEFYELKNGKIINGKAQDGIIVAFRKKTADGDLMEDFVGPATGEGYRKTWYKNGVLESTVPVVNGKPHGQMKIYFESGKLKNIVPCVDGKVQGTVIEYHESGKVKSEAVYANDVENGLSKEYDKYGQLKTSAEYVDGILVRNSSKKRGDGKWPVAIFGQLGGSARGNVSISQLKPSADPNVMLKTSEWTQNFPLKSDGSFAATIWISEPSMMGIKWGSNEQNFTVHDRDIRIYMNGDTSIHVYGSPSWDALELYYQSIAEQMKEVKQEDYFKKLPDAKSNAGKVLRDSEMAMALPFFMASMDAGSFKYELDLAVDKVKKNWPDSYRFKKVIIELHDKLKPVGTSATWLRHIDRGSMQWHGVEDYLDRTSFSVIYFWPVNSKPDSDASKLNSEYQKMFGAIRQYLPCYSIGIGPSDDYGKWEKIIEGSSHNSHMNHFIEKGSDEYDEVNQALNIATMPVGFLLDSKGKIIQKLVGQDGLDILASYAQ